MSYVWDRSPIMSNEELEELMNRPPERLSPQSSTGNSTLLLPSPRSLPASSGWWCGWLALDGIFTSTG